MAVKRLAITAGIQEKKKLKTRFKQRFQELQGDISDVGNLAQAKAVLEKMRKFIWVLARYAFDENDGE